MHRLPTLQDFVSHVTTSASTTGGLLHVMRGRRPRRASGKTQLYVETMFVHRWPFRTSSRQNSNSWCCWWSASCWKSRSHRSPRPRQACKSEAWAITSHTTLIRIALLVGLEVSGWSHWRPNLKIGALSELPYHRF